MMNIATMILFNQKYARIETDEQLITDVQSALDLIATVRYRTDCDRVAIPREAFSEALFRLGTGFAGDVLQKFVNYQMKLAIIGDFSCVKSEPLRDFITESNRGTQVFFTDTPEEAGRRLCGV